MTQTLSGKTIVVTAAAQGIGRASAIAYRNAGGRVLATDVNEAALAALAAETGIETAVMNVLDDASVADVIGRVGAVDVLFNCAGVVHGGTVLDVTDKEVDFAYDLNVKAMIRTIRAVLPGMLARGDGAIVNMSSVASSVKGVPNRFIYGTTKAAVIGLTKAIAADYVGKASAATRSARAPSTARPCTTVSRATGDYENALSSFIARQPIGRIGTPEEIADLALYLSTATYTTGAVHVIDGGWVC